MQPASPKEGEGDSGEGVISKREKRLGIRHRDSFAVHRSHAAHAGVHVPAPRAAPRASALAMSSSSHSDDDALDGIEDEFESDCSGGTGSQDPELLDALKELERIAVSPRGENGMVVTTLVGGSGGSPSLSPGSSPPPKKSKLRSMAKGVASALGLRKSKRRRSAEAAAAATAGGGGVVVGATASLSPLVTAGASAPASQSSPRGIHSPPHVHPPSTLVPPLFVSGSGGGAGSQRFPLRRTHSFSEVSTPGEGDPLGLLDDPQSLSRGGASAAVGSSSSRPGDLSISSDRTAATYEPVVDGGGYAPSHRVHPGPIRSAVKGGGTNSPLPSSARSPVGSPRRGITFADQHGHELRDVRFCENLHYSEGAQHSTYAEGERACSVM